VLRPEALSVNARSSDTVELPDGVLGLGVQRVRADAAPGDVNDVTGLPPGSDEGLRCVSATVRVQAWAASTTTFP